MSINISCREHFFGKDGKVKYQYILILGSNLGDKKEFLNLAAANLSLNALILKKTEIKKTKAFHIHNQPDFFNQGILIETKLSPEKLLLFIKEIERDLGRKHNVRYGPREIDIDIVWYSGERYKSDKLSVPHTQNRARSWVREFIVELKSEAVDETVKVKYKDMNVKPITKISDFLYKKKNGEKISVLTCYDYSIAKLLSKTSVDTVLVGDSLANVFQGRKNTLPVTLDEMIYHAKAVRRGCPDAFITVDMPFLSFQVSPEETVKNAGRILKETGCDAVKIEGVFYETIEKMVKASIPVMGHLGLTPQSVLKFGGYGLQAKQKEEQYKLIEDALSLQSAGCFSMVLEMIPAALTGEISKKLEIPTIGIGAGPNADGQVLVINDLLGIDEDFSPKFVRKYADLSSVIMTAVENYCADVRKKDFPSEKESF